MFQKDRLQKMLILLITLNIEVNIFVDLNLKYYLTLTIATEGI